MLFSIDDFVVSVKINFYQRHTKCIDDQDKFRSVKDTDNEFTECEQVDCLNNLESDSCDKNDMQKKVHVLVRLHKAMQEKLKTASYSDLIQIFTLVYT